MARTSSLSCLSCRNPYQAPDSLDCLPPLHWKTLFLTDKFSLRCCRSSSVNFLIDRRNFLQEIWRFSSDPQNNQYLSLQSNLKHGWFTRKFANHIWTPRFVWTFCLSPLALKGKARKVHTNRGFRCGSRTFAWTSHVSDWIVGRGTDYFVLKSTRENFGTFFMGNFVAQKKSLAQTSFCKSSP